MRRLAARARPYSERLARAQASRAQVRGLARHPRHVIRSSPVAARYTWMPRLPPPKNTSTRCRQCLCTCLPSLSQVPSFRFWRRQARSALLPGAARPTLARSDYVARAKASPAARRQGFLRISNRPSSALHPPPSPPSLWCSSPRTWGECPPCRQAPPS